MPLNNKLSLEQQFLLTVYISHIKQLNNENTKQYLLLLLNRMLIKDNIIKYIVTNYSGEM
uniref:phycytochrome bilisome degradation protein n=1 Tax=Rhodella violacea TaxID=2801 RepID=UPI001FCD837E|nr:phycytochrome bilisome degradation protein [Rhodella violacea]UNJ18121.1 phycytochrome bilisome degradation protein [Rhodella violacea]